MNKERLCFQGGVYYVDLSPVSGNEQDGFRPCVCVSNDTNNLYAKTYQFVPLTTQEKKCLPIHYELRKSKYHFLKQNSIVLTEQITTKSKNKVQCFLGRIDSQDLQLIKECIKIQLDL